VTPRERIAELYLRYPQTRTFEEDIRLHRVTGYVLDHPDIFLMGRPVRREAPMEAIICPHVSFSRSQADSWFIWAMSGKLSLVWETAPYELPYVGWIRRNRRIRWYDCLYAKRVIELVESSGQIEQTVVSFG
jgi:hypothetical protein